ncbi:hypothetical protein ACFPJ1_40975 [Kribbella qitaiheensis]|uniref:hypothetical protein n=1 Tax=Kribbella qitaiheensis TaxID=1544730 RepID=UPI003615897C
MNAEMDGDWPPRKRWIRYSPRLGRLVTTIDLFDAELEALKESATPQAERDWRNSPIIKCARLDAQPGWGVSTMDGNSCTALSGKRFTPTPPMRWTVR